MRKALLLGRTNERLVVVCLFSNLPGKRYKKKQISGFYERGKKEEVLTSDEKGDEKKEKFQKAIFTEKPQSGSKIRSKGQKLTK